MMTHIRPTTDNSYHRYTHSLHLCDTDNITRLSTSKTSHLLLVSTLKFRKKTLDFCAYNLWSILVRNIRNYLHKIPAAQTKMFYHFCMYAFINTTSLCLRDQFFNSNLFFFRNRIRLSSTQALYLLVNNRSMMSLSLTLAEVYAEHSESDGFLYITYASQEVFGNNSDINFSLKQQFYKQNVSVKWDLSMCLGGILKFLDSVVKLLGSVLNFFL